MIKIQNVYYMLCYAFRALNKQGYKDLGSESFENVGDLCAEILIKGLNSLIKQGLGKEYIEVNEALSSPRGKINISDSVKTRTLTNKRLSCSYDEFSVNSKQNRIIKTTMNVLLKSDIQKDRKKRLRKLEVHFVNVQPVSIQEIEWHMQYNRNNDTYRMLIGICYLVLHGSILNRETKKRKFMEFKDDDMAYVYENFVREYYKKEYPCLKVHAPRIHWALDDEMDDFLPIMRTDITIEDGYKMLIIDTKYYGKILNGWRDKNTISSSNVYQMYAYIKNKEVELKNKPHVLSGMLLYAKTDENDLPNVTYQMHGNLITITTLDLNQEFDVIKNQLNAIVTTYFGI